MLKAPKPAYTVRCKVDDELRWPGAPADRKSWSASYLADDDIVEKHLERIILETQKPRKPRKIRRNKVSKPRLNHLYVIRPRADAQALATPMLEQTEEPWLGSLREALARDPALRIQNWYSNNRDHCTKGLRSVQRAARHIRAGRAPPTKAGRAPIVSQRLEALALERLRLMYFTGTPISQELFDMSMKQAVGQPQRMDEPPADVATRLDLVTTKKWRDSFLRRHGFESICVCSECAPPADV